MIIEISSIAHGEFDGQADMTLTIRRLRLDKPVI